MSLLKSISMMDDGLFPVLLNNVRVEEERPRFRRIVVADEGEVVQRRSSWWYAYTGTRVCAEAKLEGWGLDFSAGTTVPDDSLTTGTAIET